MRHHERKIALGAHSPPRSTRPPANVADQFKYMLSYYQVLPKVHPLPAKEGKYWKIVAIRVDDGSNAGITPN